MEFWDEAGWLAIGGYYALKNGAADFSQRKKVDKVTAIIQSLTDEPLERRLREEITCASAEKYDEVWRRIEEFKRDNQHLIKKHISTSYWGHVGKCRFAFTREKMCLELGKSKLTKSDEKLLSTYRGWTITLLMNTYGKYSVMEATRIAFRDVYGPGKESWTREFG